MALTAKATVDSTGIVLSGAGIMKDDLTLKQDATRVAALAPYTVLAKEASSGKYVPLTDVDPALASAYLTCGANGGVIGAYEAVEDGEFAITVDGEDLEITGLNFDTATTFQQVEDTINVALGDKALCVYDALGDVFLFYSKTQGLPQSSITVLSAVSGGSGTDISGASFLNGLAATGTVTAATGGDGENLPAGIYWGSSVTAAALVADDVENRKILVGGDLLVLDEDKVVLENSLDLDDVITSTGQTIREALEKMGIYTRDNYINGAIAPV